MNKLGITPAINQWAPFLCPAPIPFTLTQKEEQSEDDRAGKQRKAIDEGRLQPNQLGLHRVHFQSGGSKHRLIWRVGDRRGIRLLDGAAPMPDYTRYRCRWMLLCSGNTISAGSKLEKEWKLRRYSNLWRNYHLFIKGLFQTQSPFFFSWKCCFDFYTGCNGWLRNSSFIFDYKKWEQMDVMILCSWPMIKFSWNFNT